MGGFDRASMNAVGVRAGVANGTVFFHFESKSLLYREVVRHAADAFHAAVAPLARRAGTSFMQVVDGHTAFLRDHPGVARVLWWAWVALPRPEIREGAREVDARLVGVWLDWIAARQAEPSADTEGLARLVTTAVWGLLAAQHVEPELDPRSALAGFATFVETAVAAGADGARWEAARHGSRGAADDGAPDGHGGKRG